MGCRHEGVAEGTEEERKGRWQGIGAAGSMGNESELNDDQGGLQGFALGWRAIGISEMGSCVKKEP
jgi:hypothetical protein